MRPLIGSGPPSRSTANTPLHTSVWVIPTCSEASQKKRRRPLSRHFASRRSMRRPSTAWGWSTGRRTKGLRKAIGFFRDALRSDKAYAEAQYNLAQTFQQYVSSETLGAYQDVLKIDPDHPDALFQLGRIHEAAEEFSKAETAYRRQVDVHPAHFGAQLRLGVVLNHQGRNDEAAAVLEGVAVTPNPYRRHAVLELASVHQDRRDFDRSQSLFETYIEALDPKEQALYADLRLVAGGRELQRFEAASEEERKGDFGDVLEGSRPSPCDRSERTAVGALSPGRPRKGALRFRNLSLGRPGKGLYPVRGTGSREPFEGHTT